MDPSHTLAAFGALALVLGLVWAAARAFRATGLTRPGTGRRLLPQESLALDRTRRLHLVACDGRDLLLLTGGATDVVVAWLPSRDGPA